MRVDPKKLRGSFSVGLAGILVLGTAAMVGSANIAKFESPSEMPGQALEQQSVASGSHLPEIEPFPIEAGTRVAVFMAGPDLPHPLLVLDSALVKRVTRSGVDLAVAEAEEELLQVVASTGNQLKYVQIPTHGVSPYEGEGPKHAEELKKMLQVVGSK